jgi:hypothetical protein
MRWRPESEPPVRDGGHLHRRGGALHGGAGWSADLGGRRQCDRRWARGTPFEYRPNLVQLEGRIAHDPVQALAERGHNVQWWPNRAGPAESVCMIHHDLASGVKSAAADFRRTAYAVGW